MFNDEQRVSLVVNNAGIMKNQKLFDTPPDLIEAMLKTNISPYVYMTKYALQHFEKNGESHSKKNGLIYISSSVSFVGFKFFGPYSSTKMHNDRLASLVGKSCNKSTVFGDLVDVQSVHPSAVTSNLNDFMKTPDACTPEECANGALATFGIQKKTCGAFKHTFVTNSVIPFVVPFPQLTKMLADHISSDPHVVLKIEN